MAVMYPKEPPREFPSSAEERLYYEMRRQLSDDFTVMHGVSWLDAHSHYRHVEGEADFVILHEELGIIILEVKGGRISLEDGRWFSIDRHDRTHDIKNPMEQARRSMRAILDRLKRTPSVHRFLEQYNFHTGVMLPDIPAPKEGMGSHVPREVIIDGPDVHTLERSLRRMVSRKRPPTRMTKPAIRAFVDLLRPSEVFDDATFATAILESGRQIEAYTESQFKVLELLRIQRRIAIPGCAGSGKTLLALRKAKYLAQNGLNVLLTCYNRPLADWLNQQVTSDPIDGSGSVRANNFHRLADKLLLDSGLTPPRRTSGTQSSRQFFDVDIPEYLFDNIDSVSERFDAVIVDEGQDFSPAMWMALEALLKSPESSIFYVFFDAEQGIYQDQATFPVKISDIALMKNLRNTAPIHQKLIDYYAGDVRPESIGIQGLDPEIIAASAESRSQELRRVFNRLLNEENIPPDDLVILTFAGSKNSEFQEGDRIGKFRLWWSTINRPANSIQISTVHSFKGLERPIVILLVEIDHIPRSQHDKLIYIALSRAKQHLIVIGELPDPQGTFVPTFEASENRQTNTGASNESRPIEQSVERAQSNREKIPNKQSGESRRTQERTHSPVCDTGNSTTKHAPSDFKHKQKPRDSSIDQTRVPAETAKVQPNKDCRSEPKPSTVTSSTTQPANHENPSPTGTEKQETVTTSNPTTTKANEKQRTTVAGPASRSKSDKQYVRSQQSNTSRDRADSQSTPVTNGTGGKKSTPARERAIALPANSAVRAVGQRERSITSAPYLSTDSSSALAAASCYLIWFVVPILVLVSNTKNDFVRAHAHQGLIVASLSSAYFVALFVASVAMLMVSELLLCVIWIFWLVPIALSAYLALRVYSRGQAEFVFLSAIRRALVGRR